MAAAIQAVLENSSAQNRYNLFVLQMNCRDDYKSLLREQVARYKNFSIDFIDMTSYVEHLDFHSGWWPKEAYFRLFAPFILSAYTKIIYFDCDTICLKDPALLFNIDIGDNLAGFALDLYPHNRKQKNYITKTLAKDELEYFSSGVVLFNAELFRKTIALNELTSLAASNDWIWLCADQDVLNYVCKGRTYFLPLKWNVIDDTRRNIPAALAAEYQDARKDPYLIHFQPDKPLVELYISARSKYFWKYAAHSAFIDIIIDGIEEPFGLVHGITDILYMNVLRGYKYGLPFILKCFVLWFIRRAKWALKLLHIIK